VIVYWFNANCDIPVSDDDRLKREDISFMDGSGLGLMVDVCDEVSSEFTTTRGEDTRHYRYITTTDDCCIPHAYRRSGTGGHDHWRNTGKPLANVIEWTPERERVISELCKKMDELIVQLDALFADKKQFEIRLDDMKSLLMPPVAERKP